MTEENLPDLPAPSTHRAYKDYLVGFYTADQVREYAEVAVVKERERCAMICENHAPRDGYSILGNVGDALKRAAAEIRARGTE